MNIGKYAGLVVILISIGTFYGAISSILSESKSNTTTEYNLLLILAGVYLLLSNGNYVYIWEKKSLLFTNTLGWSSTFFIVLSFAFIILFVSYTPSYYIIEPKTINETFSPIDGSNESIKTFSIKNIGADMKNIYLNINGMEIKSPEGIANNINNSTTSILNEINNINRSKEIKNIEYSTMNIKRQSEEIRKSSTDIATISKKINTNIIDITNNISKIKQGRMEQKASDAIINIGSMVESINSSIDAKNEIYVSLNPANNITINSGDIKFVSVKIDASKATLAGEYRDTIVMESDTNNEKIHENIPITIKIEFAKTNSSKQTPSNGNATSK